MAEEENKGTDPTTYALIFAVGVFIFVLFVWIPSAFGVTMDIKNTGGVLPTVSAECGKKEALQNPPSLSESQCSTPGPTTPVVSNNGFYSRTSFGCSGPESGWDPPSADNCIGRCDSLKSITKTDGTTLTLPSKDASPRGTYQSMVEYFVANMDQYGCGSKLKLTDPKTGKAANVVVIDRGPYCGVYHGHDMQINGAPMRIDISNAASNYLGSPDILKVEKLLDNNAPIGPLPECVADNGKKSITGAFGNLLDAYLYSKPMNNSALTFSSTNCPVSWEL